jgi:hypothetical protein
MTKVLETTILFYLNKNINIILCKTKKKICYLYNELEKKQYKINKLLRNLHSSIKYAY